MVSSVLGQNYTLSRSSTGAGWTPVESDVAGTGGDLDIDDPGIMPGNPVMLYQVETTADAGD